MTKPKPKPKRAENGNLAINGNEYEYGYDPLKSLCPRAPITTSNEFIKGALKEHNKFRAKHHAPPLKVNRELCKIAQAWANQLVIDNKMYHSTYEFGENLYWCNQDVTPEHAVWTWYKEIKDWDWEKMAAKCEDVKVYHFTQVIWKKSKEIGIARAYTKEGHIFVVCEYNPPGNFVNRDLENVLPE